MRPPLGLWAWSQGTWAAALAASPLPEVAFVVRLAGTDHAPTFDGRHDRDAVSPEYSGALKDWIDRQLGAG